MLKILSGLGLLFAVFIVLGLLIYLFQENLIFYPEKLPDDYPYPFNSDYEELSIVTDDNTTLNALLFTTYPSNGLIFYLHGNAGSLDSWGTVASSYTSLNYDIFILDYRGYGKSEGSIGSEQQLYSDVQTAYNEMRSRYEEKDIIVLGYSLGSAAAAKLAADNNPQRLILQAPFYSMLDLKKKFYPYIPNFLVKYEMPTYVYLDNCAIPVTIFHGDRDEVVYYESSLKLQKYLKSGDELVTLPGQPHNGITDNPLYQQKLKGILLK